MINFVVLADKNPSKMPKKRLFLRESTVSFYKIHFLVAEMTSSPFDLVFKAFFRIPGVE